MTICRLGGVSRPVRREEEFVPVSPSEASSSGGMTPLIVMVLLRIWVFSESVEFDMLEIFGLSDALCARG